MGNELLDAAQESDSSEDRYEKLKKEKAGTEMTEAEKRYEKLKEEAKREFIERQMNNETEDEDKEEDKRSGKDGFITY